MNRHRVILLIFGAIVPALVTILFREDGRPAPRPSPPESSGVQLSPQPITVAELAVDAPWIYWGYEGLSGKNALMREWKRFNCIPRENDNESPATCLSAFRARDFCEYHDARIPTEQQAVEFPLGVEQREWVRLSGEEEVFGIAMSGGRALPASGAIRAPDLTFRCVYQRHR